MKPYCDSVFVTADERTWRCNRPLLTKSRVGLSSYHARIQWGIGSPDPSRKFQVSFEILVWIPLEKLLDDFQDFQEWSARDLKKKNKKNFRTTADGFFSGFAHVIYLFASFSIACAVSF